MGIVAEPNEELKATIEWLRERVKWRDERIAELEAENTIMRLALEGFTRSMASEADDEQG